MISIINNDDAIDSKFVEQLEALRGELVAIIKRIIPNASRKAVDVEVDFLLGETLTVDILKGENAEQQVEEYHEALAWITEYLDNQPYQMSIDMGCFSVYQRHLDAINRTLRTHLIHSRIKHAGRKTWIIHRIHEILALRHPSTGEQYPGASAGVIDRLGQATPGRVKAVYDYLKRWDNLLPKRQDKIIDTRSPIYVLEDIMYILQDQVREDLKLHPKSGEVASATLAYFNVPGYVTGSNDS